MGADRVEGECRTRRSGRGVAVSPGAHMSTCAPRGWATVLLVLAVALGASSAAQAEGAESLYPVQGAPTAAFVSLPALPHVGETVTLVSTSTDLVSPITGYGWDVADVGGFQAGGPTMTTSFPTPADQLVRLQVTASDGMSSIASETIHVSRAAATVMYPFPVIRIVGTDFPAGTRVRLLAVKAPAGAQIVVTCRGPGCHTRLARRAVRPSSRRERWMALAGFETLLRPGASLTVRVSKPPLIGAYTRFSIRPHRLPLRVDSCLDPAGVRPILCPP